jgi:hypothetical protein
MTIPHDRVLADLEEQIRTAGGAVEDIDERIARALKVPPDYYFAYLLVSGAIEARGTAASPAGAGAQGLPNPARAGAKLADRIAWLGCRIYRDAASLGRDGIELALLADELLGLFAELRRHLEITDSPTALGRGRAVDRA